MSAGHGLRLPAEDRIALLSDQDAAGDIESSRSSGGGGVPLPSARADRGRLWWRIQQAAATGARSRSTRGVFSTAAATVVCVAVAVVALVLAISASWRSSGSGLGSPNSTDRNPGAPIYAGIPKTAFDQGLLKCRFIQEFTLNLAHFHHHERQLQQRQGGRVENPRFPINGTHEGSVQPPADWLITHAKLWDGDGVLYEDVDILISKGLVKKVSQPGTRISNNGSDQVLPEIDAQGRFVTPGLVDMHSHIGTDSWPAMDMTSDTNEISNTPVTPFVKSIDGINPDDLAIEITNGGGVTTSLILPGSGNLIGGEAYIIKHRPPKSNLVSDLLIHYKDTESPNFRYVKMACGENAVRSYGRRLNIMPDSRLGEGWLFRKSFEQAEKMMQAQDDWCEAAAWQLGQAGNDTAHRLVSSRFPEELEVDLIVGLLRGQVKLHNHCYETYDLEMMIRNSHQFGFKVNTFHHALEAWKIAPTLASENISVAIFADHFGFKKEAYNSSVKAPQILAAAGVEVAFKSDHPVLNSQHLVFEAQKAHHYGFNESLAIKAITSVPAKALGIEYRVGYLREGFDADVVLWDRNPLEIGAHPLKVWVDGHETFTHPLFHSKQPPHHDNHPSGAPLKSKKKETSVKTAATTTTSTFAAKSEEMRIESSRVSNSYFIENLSTIYADRNVTLSADPAGDETLSLVVVVEEGLVKCMGTAKACNVTSSLHPDMKTMDAQGGVMIPGMIAAHGRLGLEEIESERVTKDGYAHFDPATGGTRAVDGLRVWKSGSKELTAAYNSGCLFGVSLPRASGFVQGQSCVFRTGAEGFSTAVVEDVVGVTVVLGMDAKEGSSPSLTNSLAGQIGLLRSMLMAQVHVLEKNATLDPENPYLNVLIGKRTLFVESQEANDMSRLIRLKNEIASVIPVNINQTMSFTIVGGAEAWTIAEEIAASNISVILRPPRCTPGSWATRRCLVPGTYPSAIELLRRAGVNVALANVEDNFIRGLIFEAAWAFADSNDPNAPVKEPKMSKSEAIGLVTWNAAQASGISSGVGRIIVGQPAAFVVYDGDPLQLGSKIRVIGDSQHLTFWPSQF